MKSIKLKNLVFMAILAMSASSCSSPTGTGAESYKTYGEQIEDKKIVARVRETFRKNPTIPEHLVHISIDRGVLQLSGFVHNMQEADLITLSASNTPGVKGVIDNLVLLSGSEYAKFRADVEARDTSR